MEPCHWGQKKTLIVSWPWLDSRHLLKPPYHSHPHLDMGEKIQWIAHDLRLGLGAITPQIMAQANQAEICNIDSLAMILLVINSMT